MTDSLPERTRTYQNSLELRVRLWIHTDLATQAEESEDVLQFWLPDLSSADHEWMVR